MASSGSHHDFDGACLRLHSVKGNIVFLLDLADTVAGCLEVVNKHELFDIKCLRDGDSTRDGPVRNVCCVDRVVLYGASDANHTDGRPLIAVGFSPTEEFFDAGLEALSLLGV